MLAFRCQCGCLHGCFDHPDVTKIVEFGQQWKECEGFARILVPPTKEEIDETAYYLWVEAGRPVSDGKEFWHQAEEKLSEGIVRLEIRKAAYSAGSAWKCPQCGVEHRRGHNVDRDYEPLYKEEWVGPCSCGKPLDDSPYSYCLDCARKKEKHAR